MKNVGVSTPANVGVIHMSIELRDPKKVGEYLDWLVERGLLKRSIDDRGVHYRLTREGAEVAGLWEDLDL